MRLIENAAVRLFRVFVRVRGCDVWIVHHAQRTGGSCVAYAT
jgi:hypothetical protein